MANGPSWWIVRISLPLLGGAWGAWLGFRGYFSVALNADTSAPVFVLGVYALFALIGLVAGAATCALIGGGVELLLRRIGAGIVATMIVAGSLDVVALWQAGEFVAARYPGLRAERAAKPRSDGATIKRVLVTCVPCAPPSK